MFGLYCCCFGFYFIKVLLFFFKLTLICYRDQIRERRRGRKLNKLEVQNNSKSSLSTAKELTEEEMEKETKIILNEYLQLQDIKVL